MEALIEASVVTPPPPSRCSNISTTFAVCILFCYRIFELAPAALDMFSFGHEGLAADSEALYKHPLFKRHAKGVVNMLDTAIGMLGPDVSPLLEALKDLGARHFEYGVIPAHYPIVGEALICTLEVALGKKWTPKVKQGWTAIYGIVSTAMLEGANRRIQMENKLRNKMVEEEQDEGTAKKEKKTTEEVVPLAPGEAPQSRAEMKRMSVTEVKPSVEVVTRASPPQPALRKSPCYDKVAAIKSSVRRRRMMRRSQNVDTERGLENVTKALDKAISLSTSLHSVDSEMTMSTTTSDHSFEVRSVGPGLSTTSPYSGHSSSSLSTKNNNNVVMSCMKERILYLTMVEMVMDSWYRIKCIPNFREVAGVLLFRNIFKLAPAAKAIFQFTRGYDDADEEQLYKSRAFISHAKTVVKMLDDAVNMLSDLEILGEELEKLGARHVSYGVLPPHYDIVGEALLQTLEQALGKEAWNDTIKEGWTGIYVFVSTSMVRGANNVMKEQQQQSRERSTTKPVATSVGIGA